MSKFDSVTLEARMSAETEKTLMEKEHHLYEQQCNDTADWAIKEYNEQKGWEDLFDAKLVSVDEHRIKLGLEPFSGPPRGVGSQLHLVTLLSH